MVSDENTNDSQTEFRRATVADKRLQLRCEIVNFHDRDQGKDSISYTICKSTSEFNPPFGQGSYWAKQSEGKPVRIG